MTSRKRRPPINNVTPAASSDENQILEFWQSRETHYATARLIRDVKFIFLHITSVCCFPEQHARACPQGVYLAIYNRPALCKRLALFSLNYFFLVFYVLLAR